MFLHHEIIVFLLCNLLVMFCGKVLQEYSNILLLVKFQSTKLSIHCQLSPESATTTIVMIFYFHRSFYIYSLAIYCKEEFFLLHLSFMYVCMDVCVCAWMYACVYACMYLYQFELMSFYSLPSVVLYTFIFSIFRLSQIWLVKGPSGWLLCPFAVSPLFVEHCLTF